MPKKKKKDQGTGAFTTSPFKTLKGFVPTVSPPPAPSSRKSTPGGEEDEKALFLQAVSGAKKLDPSGERGNEPSGPGPTPVREVMDDDKSGAALFLREMGTINKTMFDASREPEEDESSSRSPSSRMRQLKRGTLRIGQELDLHGFLKDEALQRLGHFIANASARGQEAVLVITGKGINSPEGPVLQGAVASWLREKGRGMVSEFFPAPRDKGGSGAFVVFLKKRRADPMAAPKK